MTLSGGPRARRARRFVALFALALAYAAFVHYSTHTYALPPNFQDTIVWSGLTLPTAVRFAPDGKVFVSEKSGIIKVFDDLSDSSPTIFADLRSQVLDYGDSGLLGLAVDPGFPARPYVYAFYTVDAPPGGTPPVYNDVCEYDNCLKFSRLVRLTSGGTTSIAQQILRDGWCQLSTNHSAGDLVFGNDGYLYVSHGEGTTAAYEDYGQTRRCSGDPPLEGGALRSQDLRTTADPLDYDGTILRINPDTGAAAPGNPLAGNGTPDDDAIIAYGLRNPYRLSIDRNNGQIWIADVGWNLWEEVNTIPNPITTVRNFGWPCYEGNGRQFGYDSANIPLCESLYTTSDAVAPFYTYLHSGTTAIAGVALYRGSNFPASYDGALFFADYSHGWIKVMAPGTNGLPNPGAITDFIPGGTATVDLQVGPGGELFYVNISAGAIHKISYISDNTPPVATMTASATSGSLPLTVEFDGTMSDDADPGDTISYSWDLNGDGTFGDATGSTASFTYTTQGAINAKLRVTDSHGAIDTAVTLIVAGGTAPVVNITAPTSGLYHVGDMVTFAGSATDPDTNMLLPASALSWRILLNHCAVTNPTDCHEHFLQQLSGVAGGTLQAPDHEYPAFLRFELTATKPPSGGLPALVTTTSQAMQPQTTTVTLNSMPSGLQVSIYGAAATTPATRTVIVNAQTTISALTPQVVGTTPYEFTSWSDGGAQNHLITVPAAGLNLTATYAESTLPLQSVWNSWDVTTQAGTPQGVVTASLTGATATVEFYESTNNGGVLKGALLSTFNTAPHPEGFNNVERYWGPGTGTVYPYAGKSTINRGSGAGESNTPMPLSVRDLQLHPPNNLHNIVAAFRVPSDGTYAISNLGVRRVHNVGGPVGLHVFNAQQAEIATLTATANQAWVTSPTTYTVPNLTAGSYLYFAVDRAGDYYYDATEIAWTISASVGPPPPPPTCTLSAMPASIDQGMSATLSWTTTNATSISIDQGVGAVSPVSSGSVLPAPAVTTVYTATATGAGGTTTCSTTVTVIPSAVTLSTWNSWDVVTQSGTPQGVVTATATGIAANVEFYESTNDGGVTKGALFGGFSTASHPEGFNNVERYWGPGTGIVYPYAGKSTVNRASGAGETGAPMPLGVRDLQLHPPNNLHNVVAAFRVPSDGTYTVSNLGVRRVHNLGGPVGYHVLNAQQLEIATLQATANQAWITSPSSYTLPNLLAGSYIYFAVDRAGDYYYDATEIAWTVTANVGAPPVPPAPTCTLSASPSPITQGMSTTLTWSTTNATGFSIDQGIGAVMPVAGGSITPSPTTTTTYTGTVTGSGGTATCSTLVTVNPPSGSTSSVWNSWEIVTQPGSPQGRVTAASTGTVANVDFYESTNDAGVTRGALFSGFSPGSHPETFNNVQQYWGAGTGIVYPYAGKSTVNRGSGAGETNAPTPLDVRDLQLHPPNNLHNVVAAFRVPTDGNYTISNLAVRRVHNLGGTVVFRVFNAQQLQIATLTATNNQAWVVSPTTYTLPSVLAGSYLYFTVDRGTDFFYYDATEIAWTVTRTGP